MKKYFYIPINQLQEGLFVDLELNWSEHPFLFSKFKIQKTADIIQIQNLGLAKVKIIISRSAPNVLKGIIQNDKNAIPINVVRESTGNNEEKPEAVLSELWQQKKLSLDKANQFRLERKKIAKRYKETQKRVSNLVRDLKMAPANAIRDTGEVIEDIMTLLDGQDNIIVSLVSLTSEEFTTTNHALNVTVLALSLAKSIGLTEVEIRTLGIAALLHDIGKVLLPPNITHKKTTLTAAEEAIMNTHVDKAVSLLSHFKGIPDDIISIIANHHVYMDGTGYPESPKDGEISSLCHILQVANHYDNMCNPQIASDALSPKVAMANLFSNYDGKLDDHYIHLFVRNFGVYPPGTIVQLNDDSIAMVSSVDNDHLLTPTIILYNPDIPAKQSLMMNLTDHPDLKIMKALKPSECSSDIFEYLGLQDRLGFFFGSNNN